MLKFSLFFVYWVILYYIFWIRYALRLCVLFKSHGTLVVLFCKAVNFGLGDIFQPTSLGCDSIIISVSKAFAVLWRFTPHMHHPVVSLVLGSGLLVSLKVSDVLNRIGSIYVQLRVHNHLYAVTFWSSFLSTVFPVLSRFMGIFFSALWLERRGL